MCRQIIKLVNRTTSTAEPKGPSACAPLAKCAHATHRWHTAAYQIVGGGQQTFGLLGVFIGSVAIALGVAVGRELLHTRPSTDSVQHLL